jgi:L-amino acid N-acyltransferase YncA
MGRRTGQRTGRRRQVKQTEGGRVTEEYLDQLEKWAYMYPRPWQMGVGSYAMQALISELRDLRLRVSDSPAEDETKG